MRGDKLLGQTPYRGFHIGLPGSAKTGALAALLNVGYKVRVLDFEGNFQPLLAYTDPRALGNLDVITFQDKLRNGDKYVEPLGIPEAFNKANQMLLEWKYTEEDGTEVNLGKSKDWGMDTIVVIDSGSSLAAAIMRRAMKMNNKTKSSMTSAVWGHARADFEDFIGLLKADDKKYHLIINMHQQMLGPQDFLAQGDADVVREKKLESIAQDLIPTRWYPVSMTKPQAQTVHGLLPIMLHFEKINKQGKEVRIIDTVGGIDIDVKIPGKGLLRQYPIETGMADIFAAMGYKAPGFGKEAA